MELFSYILICLILIWLSSNSLQEAAEFQLQDLNATTLFGQCIQYSDFFVCCQWNIRTKITRGDADILIPCEWPSWDSNTGIVDICTAGEEPDIPQALGALLGIWVLFMALEVGVWSVARAGPLHVFGLWPALVVRGLCLDRRDNPALRIPVLLVLQLNKKKCQGFPYK